MGGEGPDTGLSGEPARVQVSVAVSMEVESLLLKTF